MRTYNLKKIIPFFKKNIIQIFIEYFFYKQLDQTENISVHKKQKQSMKHTTYKQNRRDF